MIAAYIICAAAVGIALAYLATVHACLKNEAVESAVMPTGPKPRAVAQPQVKGLRQAHA